MEYVINQGNNTKTCEYVPSVRLQLLDSYLVHNYSYYDAHKLLIKYIKEVYDMLTNCDKYKFTIKTPRLHNCQEITDAWEYLWYKCNVEYEGNPNDFWQSLRLGSVLQLSKIYFPNLYYMYTKTAINNTSYEQWCAIMILGREFLITS